MWTYRAKVVKVVDGDTVDVEIDLGFRVYHKVRLRLAGLNAPEVRGAEREAGLLSKYWLKAALDQSNGESLYVQTKKTGKYGRWIATLYVSPRVTYNEQVELLLGIDEPLVNVNKLMIDRGYAEVVDYD